MSSIRLGDQDLVAMPCVHLGADALEHGVRFVEVRARRAFALDEIRHRVEAHAVDAAIEPEVHHADDGVEYVRIVEVQVGLMVEEAVPVVRAGGVVPGPVRRLGVGKMMGTP
jgi:hypothetical protein